MQQYAVLFAALERTNFKYWYSCSKQESGLTKKEEKTKEEEKSCKVKPAEKSVSEYMIDSGTSKVKAS